MLERSRWYDLARQTNCEGLPENPEAAERAKAATAAFRASLGFGAER